MQKEPRGKRILCQGWQTVLQKPCPDGNLIELKIKMAAIKSAKFVHRNVGIFSTPHIFFCFFIERKNPSRFFWNNL